MIPLAAGPYELVLEQLYQLLAKDLLLEKIVGMGLIVALMYRLILISVAVVGIGYYFVSRGALQNQ